MWDKQGVLRGECSCGDCEEFMTGSDVRCDYCDCVPTKHKKIEGDAKNGKNYSLETYNTFPVPPVVVHGNKLVVNGSHIAPSSSSDILQSTSDVPDTKPGVPVYLQPENNTPLSDSTNPNVTSDTKHIQPLDIMVNSLGQSGAASDSTSDPSLTGTKHIQPLEGIVDALGQIADVSESTNRSLTGRKHTQPLEVIVNALRPISSSDPSVTGRKHIQPLEVIVNSLGQISEVKELVVPHRRTKLETPLIASQHIKVECDSDTSCYSLKDLTDLPDLPAKERSLEPVDMTGKNVAKNQVDATGKNVANKNVPCVFCTKMFKFIKTRNKHMKTFHSDFVNVCPMCKKLFVGRTEYAEHMQSKHPESIVNNSSADSSASDVDNDVIHMMSLGENQTKEILLEGFSVKEEPFDDDGEIVRLVSAGDLIKTEETVSTSAVSSEPIKVKLKYTKIKSQQNRPRNRRTVAKKKCNIMNDDQDCEMMDISADQVKLETVDCTANSGPSLVSGKGGSCINKNLKKRRRSKTNNVRGTPTVRVKCDLCDKMFPSEERKKAHERVKHAPTEFHCQYCGKVYRRMYDLEDHERSHTGYRPFQCDVCDKAFYSKHNLRTHKNLHKTRGAFVCMYCGKEFDSKGGMEYHELTHTGIRPQQCKVCNKTFKHRSALITHERIHTGEKPFHCKYCTKSFCDHSTLRKHERIHTLEKPYKCRECDKAYNQRWCLKTHYVKSHAGVPIPVYNKKYPMNSGDTKVIL